MTLQGLGIIDAPTARALEQLVYTRNALVHDYGGFTAESTPGLVRAALPLLEKVASALDRALAGG